MSSSGKGVNVLTPILDLEGQCFNKANKQSVFACKRIVVRCYYDGDGNHLVAVKLFTS